ncbi:MAG: HAMP domain-containing histidine kinase, partial [Actinobacteria bacterium]|nr:HAMP domain-containing histidine kinase [Actinomycetota bacterium]
MTAEVYKILIIVTLLMQSLCIVAGFRLIDKVENRPLLLFVLFGVGIIFLIQLMDLLALDYPSDALLDTPIYFEIISLISTLTLLMILLTLNFQLSESIRAKQYAQYVKPELKPIQRAPLEIKPVEKVEHKEVPTVNGNIEEIKAQLEKVTEQRDKLVSLISHDLRTPLNSVFGFCQLLRDGEYKGKKEVKKFAENIYDLSKIQLNAFNKILEWTRYESKDVQFNPTEFDVTSTINFISKSFLNITDKKNITIRVNSESNLMVFADEFMIMEVLKNLLENAIKYSREGSTVEIITHYHSKLNKLVILVCDSGIGINKN